MATSGSHGGTIPVAAAAAGRQQQPQPCRHRDAALARSVSHRRSNMPPPPAGPATEPEESSPPPAGPATEPEESPPPAGPATESKESPLLPKEHTPTESAASAATEPTEPPRRARSGSPPRPWEKRVQKYKGHAMHLRDRQKYQERVATIIVANKESLMKEAASFHTRRVKAQEPCFPLSSKTIVRARKEAGCPHGRTVALWTTKQFVIRKDSEFL